MRLEEKAKRHRGNERNNLGGLACSLLLRKYKSATQECRHKILKAGYKKLINIIIVIVIELNDIRCFYIIAVVPEKNIC